MRLMSLRLMAGRSASSRLVRALLAVTLLAPALLTQSAPRIARAAIRTVPVGGSLQNAVNQAQPGDVIRLAGNTQASETVNLALMGSAVGSGPGNLTIVGVNGASATLLGGNGTRLLYNSATPFPGTLSLMSVTFSTSASTTSPAVSLTNMGNVFVSNVLFDGVGAEGCASGPSGCTGLYLNFSSGSPVFGLYSSTFRNIAADAAHVDVSGTANATLAMNTNLFTDNGLNAAVTNSGIVLSATGTATVNQSIAQTSFSNLTNPAVYTVAGGNAIVATSVVSNVITNLQGTSLGAITLDTTAAAGINPTLNAKVTDNQITNIRSHGILSQYQSANGALNLQIRRNQIQTVDITSNKRGISVVGVPDPRGEADLTILNNTISDTGGSGIRVDATDLNVDAHVRNNNLSNNNVGAFGTDAGIFLRGGFGSTTGLASAFNGSVEDNSIPAAGVKLAEYTTNAMGFETNGPASTDYIQNNNNFSGGGTVTVMTGSIGDLPLNSVPVLAENFNPGAGADGTTTAPSGITTSINVLANDWNMDSGDAVNLLAFQAVSQQGAAITRNDNGTPANLADDRINFTSLPTVTGLDQFYYVIRDNGGRSTVGRVVVNVVADSTPPDTTITLFPPNPSNDTTPTFQFTGTDNVTAPANLTYQCRLYLASATPPSFSSCTSPFTSAALPSGTYIFQVRARDQVGNIDPTPAQYTWIIDGTPPTATINSGPSNPTNSTAATFTFTAEDGSGSGIATRQCSLDGAAFTSCTSPANLSSLTEGSHTFRVRATDNAGNTQATPASYTWLIDLTNPDTTITTNPPALSTSASATFSFTGNDPTSGGVAAGVAGFECQLDGSSFAACASPAAFTGLSDGPHTFAVRAIDAAGNLDATPASYAWTIDTTPPPAPVVLAPVNGSATNNTQPPASGTAEAGATVTIFIDGSAIGSTTADASGNWTMTPPVPLANGTHTVKARASDDAGNGSIDSNTNTFIVDTQQPDTTLTATPPAVTSSASAAFQFSATDSGSGINRYECSLDGAAFATCASPASLAGLAEGSHTFRVRAVDAAGNTEATPASHTWLIDLTNPDTTITANPPALSASANATFSFTGNDPTSGGVAAGVASFECSLDGAAFAACASPRTFTGLSDGPHTFAVRAIDAAGNADATPASYTWTIDSLPPPAPVTLFPANGSVTNNPQPPVSGTAEAGATVTIVIDGSAIGTTTADASGNWTLTPSAPLTDGAHTVKARASDAAGNASVDSNTHTFTIDTVEPATTLTATPPSPSNSAAATFQFTGAGTGSGINRYECSLDGAAFATCASPVNLAGLAEGSHTFRVRAVDAAGNTEATPASHTWLIDLTNPDTTITANPPALSASANATFSFTGNDPTSGGVAAGVAGFECSLDGAAFAACASPLNLTGLSDGTHTFDVRAIDLAGNRDPAPASHTWLIDTAPATVTINQAAGQADPSAVPPVSFSVTFSEPVSGFGDAGDIALGASTAPGALSASVVGSGATYTVTVSGMRGPGLVVASIPAAAAADLTGNPSLASASTDNSVTFSPAIPSVSSIALAGANPTRAATVDFTVTFSEAVANVDAADFALAPAGITGAAITGVAGGGATWIVTASTGAGNGTLGLNLVDDDSILSASAAIPLGGLGAGNGNATGAVYTINRTFYAYLPLMLRASEPDLIASMSLTPAHTAFATGEPVTVTVVITNAGTASAAPFWVDLYANPSQPPQVNQPWNDICGLTPCVGAAWAVSQWLAPGQSITLTSAPGSYAAPQTFWPG